MTDKVFYDPVAIGLHWISALAIFLMLGMGWVMTDLPPGSALQFSLFQDHKSVGMTVLLVTVLRVLWRLSHPAPALPNSMMPWEQRMAHLGHWGLYAMILGMPLIGWGVVSTSPFNIPTVLYGIVPLPHLAFLAEMADKATVNKVLKQAHDLGAVVLALLILGHVAAALRHQFILRDGILRRMLPFLMVALGMLPVTAFATEWNVDAAKSKLGFVGTQSGAAFQGNFSHWNAKIDFDPKNPAAASVLITIDMASAGTGDKQKDMSLTQAEWFDTQHFPNAVFEAKGFRSKGGNAFETTGSLTIRGHGKEVVLPFNLDVSDMIAHATGRLSLIRTDYGVGQGAWVTGEYVATDVAVVFDVVASRKN